MDTHSEARTRYAVGAIVRYHQHYLLIHKVKQMESVTGPRSIPGHWDFPKGGIITTDTSPHTAIMRELREETGSQQYHILHEFQERMRFDFPSGHAAMYTRQETIMFLAEYTGDETDLCPQDEEIDQLAFFGPDDVLTRVPFEESQTFFVKHIVKGNMAKVL